MNTRTPHVAPSSVPVFKGKGNVYATLDGTLMSAPLLADGTYEPPFGDEWCEVMAEAEPEAEITAARRALRV